MKTVEISGYDRKTPIRSFRDWEASALPPGRKLKQWKEGRSEFELGRIWMERGEPSVPAELLRLLDSHESTRGTVIRSGITQLETTLPFANRGPRCHDLALLADHDGSTVSICIEAKADESFGRAVGAELLAARNRTPRTKFPDRLDWLTSSLLGIPAFADDERKVLSDEITSMPYQLFSALGGTLLEADLQGARKAVLVVHEFRTPLTTDVKMNANASALDGFLQLVLASNGSTDTNFGLEPGQLYGPVSIIDRPIVGTSKMPCHIPFFVGKIRTDCISP